MGFAWRCGDCTIQGYITPVEALTKHRPDLSHLRIWGCKAYVKLPRDFSRKDFRDKSLVGHFVGYSEEGEIGYKISIPEHKKIVVGVHVLFNKIVFEYSETYYNEIKKLKVEVVEEEITVESFAYLEGMRCVGDENYLEYQNVELEIGRDMWWCGEQLYLKMVHLETLRN